MPASPLTSVSILTGFLGAGKTTLLNRLLAHPDLRDTAVLVNEFGAVAIDHHLVRQSSEDIAVLKNGCVCCSVAGELVNALRSLYFQRAKGTIPAFERVVIETTGLADPAPILTSLIDLPLTAARYALSGVVCVVDAEHGSAHLDTHLESLRQVAM
ncbi:MAG TPA: GTP-binding protein, partial [Usitatibacteraceae bacterium]|nr:GTP-binding protein [Usitatibacteraceae bacterium]